MLPEHPRLLVVGAHPDDAEFHAGGLIARYCGREYPVKIVSVTNGCSGHHRHSSEQLAVIRRDETKQVAELTGAEYAVWDFLDGQLQPTLDVRERVIREIRFFQPDLVLTHRTCDYHPDHRAVGQAVQDASYLVTVPLVVTDQPAIRKDPVVAYMCDFFTRPNPLCPDVVLDIESEFPTVVDMLMCHTSQVFEWLPYNHGIADVPHDHVARKQWLADWFAKRASEVADRFRDALCANFGDQRGSHIRYAEAYEISEYAGDMDAAKRERLFPK
jgi:LmbE family N-acetylglucosaminyl deacetylase